MLKKAKPRWSFLRTYSTSFRVWHWSNSTAANFPSFCRISWYSVWNYQKQKETCDICSIELNYDPCSVIYSLSSIFIWKNRFLYIRYILDTASCKYQLRDTDRIFPETSLHRPSGSRGWGTRDSLLRANYPVVPVRRPYLFPPARVFACNCSYSNLQMLGFIKIVFTDRIA